MGFVRLKNFGIQVVSIAFDIAIIHLKLSLDNSFSACFLKFLNLTIKEFILFSSSLSHGFLINSLTFNSISSAIFPHSSFKYVLLSNFPISASNFPILLLTSSVSFCIFLLSA